MKHTPLDLEMAVGKVSFFEASLVPAFEATLLAPETSLVGDGVET
jgi:hypothetical protein